MASRLRASDRRLPCFVRVASDGKLHPLPVGASRLKVTVVERPRAVDGERLIRMELTGHAHTACQVLVAGTASDPHAAIGAGIDAVHVWAIASGAASPVFVGAATLDRDRFSFTAKLTPGTYTVTANAWHRRTERWEDSRTVTVAIR